MSNFTALPLSKTVSCHDRVTNESGFMGLFPRTVYKPTHSQIDSYRNYFSVEVGNSLFCAINAPAEKAEQSLEAMEELPSVDDGDIRMDLCLSRDHQFAAVQLFRRQGIDFVPVTEITYLEGNAAALLEDKLV